MTPLGINKGRLMPQRDRKKRCILKKKSLFWFDNFCMIFLNHSFLKIERVREMLCRKVIQYFKLFNRK